MNDHELDLALEAIGAHRTRVTAPPALRARARAVPVETPQRQSWLPRIHQGGFDMFSALKFVAAGVIVALFGGLVLAGVLTTPQGEEMAPAGVTASPTPGLDGLEDQADEDEMVGATHVTGISEGYRTVSEGSMAFTDVGASLRGEVQEREVKWSDPRLPSSMQLSGNSDFYGVASDVGDGAAPLDVLRETVGGAISLVQNVRLEDSNGTWTGTIHGLLEETMVGRYPQTVLMVLQGEGAYEGLSAMFTTTYEEPPAQREVPDWVGYIFEGEITPVPEPPEPTTIEQ